MLLEGLTSFCTLMIQVSASGVLECRIRKKHLKLEDQHLEIPNYDLSTSWKAALRRTSVADPGRGGSLVPRRINGLYVWRK